MGRKALLLLTLMAALVMVSGTALAITYTTSKRVSLKLNKPNYVATALTRLASNAVGPALTLETDSTDSSATPLKLDTETPSQAPMSVDSSTKVTDLNADTVDGLNSTQFIQGQGRVIREAKAVSAGVANSTILSNDVFEMWFSCPSTPTTTNGSVAFFNKTSSQANLFSDNGGANPAYASLAPALDGIDFSLQQTTAAGESITFQMQSANGKFVTVWFNSVNRTNDCHIQVQALISD